jgi:hypothetical protein
LRIVRATGAVWLHDDVPDQIAEQVVLHLGAGKTGTSSLQYRLAANRDVLAAHGTLYPRTPGGARHTRLGMFAKSDEEMVRTGAWRRMGRPDPRRFRRRFRRRLLREIADADARRVLFSDEALLGLPEDAIRRLRKLTRAIGSEVRAVVYLRRQDERLVSQYQQEVKTGGTTTLADWAAGHGTHLHDYHQRLTTWSGVLGSSALVVRRFERSAFLNGDLYDDFLDAAGTELSASQLAPVETRNESLDAESLEFLRLLNIYRVENEAAEAGYIDNTAVVERLREQEPGPMLTLPDAVLDREMERWEQSNRATAEEFLGDPDGVLFREPRRPGTFTTEQLLDPARLGHFADLVGLDPGIRGALRILAERGVPERRT